MEDSAQPRRRTAVTGAAAATTTTLATLPSSRTALGPSSATAGPSHSTGAEATGASLRWPNLEASLECRFDQRLHLFALVLHSGAQAVSLLSWSKLPVDERVQVGEERSCRCRAQVSLAATGGSLVSTVRAAAWMQPPPPPTPAPLAAHRLCGPSTGLLSPACAGPLGLPALAHTSACVPPHLVLLVPPATAAKG